MIYFITSPHKAIIKVNGNILSEIDGNLYSFESEENCFIEIIPLDECLLPIFCKIEKAPYKSKNVCLYNLENGILVLPIFQRKNNLPFKYIYFTKKGKNSVYVYNDSSSKVLIQKEDESNILTLPFEPIKCECLFFNELLFLSVIGLKKHYILCYDLQNGITQKFTYAILKANLTQNHISYTLTNLTKLEKLINLNKNGEIISEIYTRNRAISELNPLLIPFAFLEEVILKANYHDYFHEKLLPHSDLVINFLGEFYSFIPYNKDDDHLAIIIGKKAKIVKFTLVDNKIYDISIV